RLQTPDVLEVALVTRLGEAIERGVRPLHVGGVVLVVMELHDPAGNVGLERAVVIGKLGKSVRGHWSDLLCRRQVRTQPRATGTGLYESNDRQPPRVSRSPHWMRSSTSASESP